MEATSHDQSVLKAHCKRFKPHVVMVMVQIGYTILYFVAQAAFNHGMNPHVYVTYRNILAGFVMLPFAYVLERKVRPKLTVALVGEIFLLSLLGLGLAPNMYFASLKCTSPTFISPMLNTIASLTFLIAVVLRLEMVDMRNPRGVAKVLGTLTSLGGVLMMTLYKGSALPNFWHPLISIRGSRTAIHESWVKGSLLIISTCISWSIGYIMQAYTLKRYPAQLSLTTWMCFFGAAQSSVYAALVDHRATAWTIGFNIDLWSIIYGGVVVSGLINYAQLWCTKEKGPVFITMFNPLQTLLVALSAYFVLGEMLYVGSIVGGATVIIGLYLLLWGKDERDHAAAPQIPEESSSLA